MAALTEGRLTNQTVGMVGPTEIGFDDAARLVAEVIGKRRLFIRVPLSFHYVLAQIAERSMTVPLIATAQVQILREEVIEPVRAPDGLPDDLMPSTPFDEEAIRAGLPEPGPFGFSDLRLFSDSHRADSGDSVLVFDGDCGFCTAAAKWAARQFRNGERAEAWQFLGADFLALHGLSLDDVREAAWWVDDRGRRERGYRAIGMALQGGGGLRQVLGHLVVVPPVSWLAAGLYRLVVRWRYRLPGGTPACKGA
jgi:NADH dehydrogenase